MIIKHAKIEQNKNTTKEDYSIKIARKISTGISFSHRNLVCLKNSNKPIISGGCYIAYADWRMLYGGR